MHAGTACWRTLPQGSEPMAGFRGSPSSTSGGRRGALSRTHGRIGRSRCSTWNPEPTLSRGGIVPRGTPVTTPRARGRRVSPGQSAPGPACGHRVRFLIRTYDAPKGVPFRRGSQRLAGSASPRPTSRWVPRPARRASSRRLPVPRGTAAELARCAQPPRVPFVRQPGLLRLLHCLPRRSCYAAPLCSDLPSSSPAPSPRDPVEPCHSRTRWRPPCQPTEGARRRQPPPLPVRKDVPVPLLTERDDNLHGPSYLENRAERRGGAVEAIAPPHQPEAPERARDPRHHPSCPPPTPAWPAPP